MISIDLVTLTDHIIESYRGSLPTIEREGYKIKASKDIQLAAFKKIEGSINCINNTFLPLFCIYFSPIPGNRNGIKAYLGRIYYSWPMQANYNQ